MSVLIKVLPRAFAEFDHLRAVKEKYRALRLHALKTEADNFGSRYEDEVEFLDQRWYERLQNPKGATFIAFTKSTSAYGAESIDKEDWIGTQTVLGPFVPAEAGKFIDVEEAAITGGAKPDGFRVFILVSFFVHENYRGRKVGVELLRAAEIYAGEQLSKIDGHYTGIFGLVANPKNARALRLYKWMGFEKVGEAVDDDGSIDDYLQKTLV
ncbi:hypothetical protein POJ06DRAFT_4534 [Lipomyces tetrasporus]|uniref:N-acetyltransferase domain-containing protein n=1 Tax=Lipomyces tetrasporus TaxID=54092 RepID=A0AAD7QYZ3_9ASCO|nr:uncharacterized protein POJ06DRAFT_4534 [Lipomyces tetrasporus]KAJ8103581.1 hypothetical protein POJ06DRAFT_4534 [Lipomyces tetrasporus]